MFAISCTIHSHCLPATRTRQPTRWTYEVCFLWDTNRIAIYLTRG